MSKQTKSKEVEKTNIPANPQKQRTFRPKQKDRSRGSFSR
jgi:hypothetical protein